ncbi:MAG TPA: septum formation initiator family protein [Streptosporangiaceae bacterium]|nr:septum formation initiator family protein [Streptosporangiaceae bacterium]
MSGQTEVVTQTRRTRGAPPARRAPRPRPGNAAVPARGRTGVRPAPPQTRPAGPPRGRASSARRGPDAAAAAAARASRTPFVFLVVGLLGGGLLCLLLINTILDTGSYQITQLQQENVTLAQQTQELQARIAQQQSPAVLAEKARQLGMEEPGLLHFLDLSKGKIKSQPTHAPGVSVYPPGYTP